MFAVLKLQIANARDRVIAAAIALALIAAWELAAHLGAVNTLLFPAPSHIAATLFGLARHDLFLNIRISLACFLGGLVVGAVPGIFLGLCLGCFPRLLRVVDPFIAAIHPLPKIVLFPLFIVLFGVSEWSKIAAIALTVFFPTLINAAAGARQLSPLYLEVIRSYGGRTGDAFRHVVLPGSLPMMLNGIRIAANLGLLVTIAIEFTVMSPGVGSIIWLALQTMRTEQLYAGIVVISLIGISINAPIQWVLRRLATWQ